MKLKIKQVAPNFKLDSTDGSVFELNKIKKKILYFTFILKMTLLDVR